MLNSACPQVSDRTPRSTKIPIPEAALKSLLITGSSGFIGHHLGATLKDLFGDSVQLYGVDRRAPRQNSVVPTINAELGTLSMSWPAVLANPTAVFHLASIAEVITPFALLPELVERNVSDTLRLLQAIKTRRLLFASSSSVYGKVNSGVSTPSVSAYAMSKLFGEILCRDWARHSGTAAISYRLANVVGPGCRGLIPFLVQHALTHADGSTPAFCRGTPNVVRDYIPVGHVVQAFIAGLDIDCAPGDHLCLNIGSGLRTTNGEIVQIVQETLACRGYTLRVDWRHPLHEVESDQMIIDVTETYRRLPLSPPSVAQVRRAVQDAVLALLPMSRNRSHFESHSNQF